MEDIDPEYFKNLSWILENDITSLGLNFKFKSIINFIINLIVLMLIILAKQKLLI